MWSMPSGWRTFARSISFVLAASAALSIAVPAHAAMAFSLSDANPLPGDKLYIRVRGCAPESYVRVYLDDDKIRSGRANGAGLFWRGHSLPQDATPGRRQVRVVCLNDVPGGVREEASQEIVVRRQLSVDDNVVLPGATFPVRGGGCLPNAMIRVWFDQESVLTVHATRNGGFSVTVRVPQNAPSGLRRVRVTCEQAYPPGSFRTIDTYVRVA